jgi:midasin
MSSILSRFLRKPPLHKGPLAFITSSEDVKDLDTLRLHRLLLAYYRILLANQMLPSRLLWPLSALSILFWTPHPDTGVRLLAIRCYALQSGMSEAEREKLEIEIFGSTWEVDCKIGFGEDTDGRREEIDGWLLPALEGKRIIDARNAFLQDSQEYYVFDDGNELQAINLTDLRQVHPHSIMKSSNVVI